MRNDSAIKGDDYARAAIAFTRANPNPTARKAMARAAISHGNYTKAARDLWRAYLSEESA